MRLKILLKCCIPYLYLFGLLVTQQHIILTKMINVKVGCIIITIILFVLLFRIVSILTKMYDSPFSEDVSAEVTAFSSLHVLIKIKCSRVNN